MKSLFRFDFRLVVLVFSVLGIFCLAALNGNNLVELDNARRPRVLHFEQTIAIARFGGQEGELESCRLLLAEQDQTYKKDQLLAVLGRGMELEEVDLPTMMAVVTNCQRILEADDEDKGDEDYNAVDENDTEYFKLFKGILPGTMWCGFDDVAPDFYKLGRAKKLDSCCRTHDHCPVKVKAFRNRYGILNLHPYTKVLCDCDTAFYNCLKSVGSKKADAVGNFFFNFLAVQCLKEDYSRNRDCNYNSRFSSRTFNSSSRRRTFNSVEIDDCGMQLVAAANKKY